MQYAKFVVIGGLATAVNSLVLVLLIEFAELNATLAVVAAFVPAFAVSYGLNRLWTFAAMGSHVEQVPKYFVGQLAGLGLNAGLMFLATNTLGLSYWWGIAASIVVTPPLVFLFQKHWTFAPARKQST